MQYAKLSPGPGMSTGEVSAHQQARIQAALIEIVAAHGYSSLNIRDVVKLAGVSTRAFYESFDSKEDCLLRTHELVARRAIRQIVAAQVGEDDWRKRPRLIYDALVSEIQKDPAAARLLLLGGGGGPVTEEQSRHFERMLVKMIGESFARAPGGVAVPELLVKGMVAGIGTIARTRVLAGRQDDLLDIGDDLMDWTLSLPSNHAKYLPELDAQSVWRDTRLVPGADEGSWSGDGDRDLILSTVAELATEASYDSLTVTRICRAAGAPRKAFSAHFGDIETCFAAALERRVDHALAQVARAQAAGRTWTGCTYRAISALCDQINEEHLLVRVCLDDDFAPGDSATRMRHRLLSPIVEQLNGAPSNRRPGPLAAEASAGSIWSIVLNHVARGALQLHRPQVAATLTYLAVAPTTEAAEVVTAIKREQKP